MKRYEIRFINDEEEKINFIKKTYSLRDYAAVVRKLINQEYEMLKGIGGETPIAYEVSILDQP